ncbi:MAG: hypothetical protein WCT14_11365 [Treponemataceae bacterium]
MSAKKNGKRLFEIVSFFIYDLGRAVDLNKAQEAVREAGFPADDYLPTEKRKVQSRDTPASLSLPTPFCFPVGESGYEKIVDVHAEIKIYDDGAMTIVIRERGRFRIDNLADAAARPVVRVGGEDLNIASWAARLFRHVNEGTAKAIVAPVSDERRDEESYTAFCLLDPPTDVESFFAEHRDEIAALIIGEKNRPRLHSGQINAALSRPFSYRADDLSVFDMDRCFIIEPRGDYEDILLIAEHANYRLLELRALDRLLDLRLEEAENDLVGYGVSKRNTPSKEASPSAKFARIQTLRFEALFILENLENSSKIIGDFYLCQIYDRLCEIFNTEGWKRSVERRLDILESVYDMAKTDTAQQRQLVLEIVFIAVCVIFPVLQIAQALIQK